MTLFYLYNYTTKHVRKIMVCLWATSEAVSGLDLTEGVTLLTGARGGGGGVENHWKWWGLKNIVFVSMFWPNAFYNWGHLEFSAYKTMKGGGWPPPRPLPGSASAHWLSMRPYSIRVFFIYSANISYEDLILLVFLMASV